MEMHTTSNAIGIMGFSIGVKRPKPVAGNSPPFTANLKVGGAIPPLPHAYSWRDA